MAAKLSGAYNRELRVDVVTKFLKGLSSDILQGRLKLLKTERAEVILPSPTSRYSKWNI